jgi:hypothetical protein
MELRWGVWCQTCYQPRSRRPDVNRFEAFCLAFGWSGRLGTAAEPIEKAWELIGEKFIQTQDFHPFVEGQGSLVFPII